MTRARRVALVYATQREAGGAERYLNQLASRLAEDGHAVSIVCRRHEEPPHPKVRFVRLPVRALGNSWRHWAFARAVERHVDATGYDVVVGLGRTWSQDVIRCGGCHRSFLDVERRRILSRFDRWRGKGMLKGWVAERIEARAYAPGRYRRVLVSSHVIRRDLQRRYGVPEEAVSVIPNGVDLERFHPRLREGAGAALRREWGIGAEEVSILFLGAGFERKGLAPLLEAMPAVRRRCPGARLVVVGRDRRQSHFEARARRLGLGEAVLFAGWRPDPEVCFAAADLHALPTYYDSFAYTVLEAMASGVPVVTSADAGAAELMAPGRHGEVLASGFSSEDLARALVAWCDPERLAAQRGAVRARAEEHPLRRSTDATARAILDVADQLEAGRAAPVGLAPAPGLGPARSAG